MSFQTCKSFVHLRNTIEYILDENQKACDQGRHALIIFEGAQVGGWGDGGWHSSRLMFYLIFPFLGYSKYSQ